jgi:hypothetical protein
MGSEELVLNCESRRNGQKKNWIARERETKQK